MRLQINGEQKEFENGLSLAQLIELLAMKADRVAIERNREIVARGQWAETMLADGDTLEIVHFVGGGWADSVGADPELQVEDRQGRERDATLPACFSDPNERR